MVPTGVVNCVGCFAMTGFQNAVNNMRPWVDDTIRQFQEVIVGTRFESSWTRTT